MGLHVADDPGSRDVHELAGRYVLGRVLGAGAMGVVRASYDPALAREVAVKLVAPGGPAALRDTGAADHTRSQHIRTEGAADPVSAAALDDAGLLAEARALAAVAHPNIVEVFDVGVCTAGVFIAMELVDGVSLRAWNAEHRPDWCAAVLEHLQAGEGLAAAHRVGIVHGDFKPDNVLVRGSTVKVVDFGLARAMGRAEPPAATAHAPQTTGGAALVFGTPAYLAPECWSGPTREPTADQFAFFVSLCESIVGRRPYARADSLGALLVALGNGPDLDALRRRVPPALLRTIARGLDPDPTRRFPSMDDALAELRTIVDDAGRGRSRRRVATAALLVAAAGTTVAFGVWLHGRMQTDAALSMCAEQSATIRSAWDDDARRRVEAAFVAAEPRAGAAAFVRVRRWLDDYATAWSSLREQSCARGIGEPQGSMELLRTACFAEREASFTALVEVLGSADDEVVRGAVRSAADLPRVDACDDEGRLSRHAALPADPQARERVTAAQRELARADQLLDARRFEQARPLVDEALATGEALAFLPLVARAHAARGRTEVMLGHYPAGEAEMQAAYFHAREADDEGGAAIAAELASLVGTKLGRFDDGLVWVRHAETALASLGGPELETHARLAIAHAAILVRKGLLEQAILPARRAGQIRLQLFGPDHPSVAAAALTLGSIYGQLGRMPESIAELERAREIFEVVHGEDHPQIAGVYHNLGMAELELGHDPEARAWMERALAIRRQWLPSDHPDVAASLAALARADLALGRFDDAQRGFEQALAIREVKLGAQHPAVVETLGSLARVASKRGNCREAARVLGRALTLVQGAGDPRGRLHVGLDLGDALLACREREGAREQYEAVLALAQADVGRFARELARAQAGVEAALTAG